MTRTNRFMGAVCALVFVLGACATAPKSESDRSNLRNDARSTVAEARANDSTLGPHLDAAKGYAVFPSVGKGGIGVGGAYGRGILFEGGTPVGYCDLSQGSIGLQLGGQTYAEIIVFRTDSALADFKNGNFEFSAQATAVAVKSGAGANAKYSNGVAVFTMAESGLMYEASIGGQDFDYQPM